MSGIDLINLNKGFTGKIFKLEEKLSEKSLVTQPSIMHKHTFSDSNWELYYFYSDIPLNANDDKIYAQEVFNIERKFQNELLFCRAHNHLLIFTTGRRALNYLLEVVIASSSSINSLLKPCYIAVDSFVKNISQKNYILTSISAFYNGANDSLKSMLLYGDDIGDTELFSKNLSLLNIYRCGIRDGGTAEEIISFSTDGSLYFKYNLHSLQKINMVFRYLKNESFLK